MKIIGYAVGPLETNCYIVHDESNGVIIDPGFYDDRIIKYISENKLKIDYIINTHGHFDHILGDNEIKKLTGGKICIHSGDLEFLKDGMKNGAIVFGFNFDEIQCDKVLEHNEEIRTGDLVFKIVHTPGHSPGSISLIIEKNVICGDLIFRKSVGRSDFMGGNHDILINSIKKNIMTLPDEFTLYPGHNQSTTIGYERNNNPFL